MFRKIFILIISYFLFFEVSFAGLFSIFDSGYKSSNSPTIHCEGLPGCQSSDTNQSVFKFTSNVIAELINYVAVFAVLALIISGIIYILSSGEEEKTKKAKKWIIWSLVGVFLSISAWFIINTINNFSIN